MNIIFVRHAKSENYSVNKRQAPDSPLGDLGKHQAKLVSNILKEYSLSKLKFDHLISSEWKRALETAEIISQEIGTSITTHPLIHEFLSNPLIANQPLDSEIVKAFEKEVAEYGHDFDWVFKGEGESMRDIINRALKFKSEVLTRFNDKNLLVISHGLFITCFITLIILGDKYDDKEFKRVSDMIHFENTGISHISYNETTKTWNIHFLNDASHLN